MNLYAYCYASGEIEFGRDIPVGGLPIARGPSVKLRVFIQAVARHAYDGKVLLVPGVPEAAGQIAKLDALLNFSRWLDDRRPPAITIIHSQHRAKLTKKGGQS